MLGDEHCSLEVVRWETLHIARASMDSTFPVEVEVAYTAVAAVVLMVAAVAVDVDKVVVHMVVVHTVAAGHRENIGAAHKDWEGKHHHRPAEGQQLEAQIARDFAET